MGFRPKSEKRLLNRNDRSCLVGWNCERCERHDCISCSRLRWKRLPVFPLQSRELFELSDSLFLCYANRINLHVLAADDFGSNLFLDIRVYAIWRFGEMIGSTAKNETTLAKTRQAILPMVLGESWVDLKSPEIRRAVRAGLPRT